MADRKLVIDDVYQMRAIVSHGLPTEVEVIITTVVPVLPVATAHPRHCTLFDKHIEGFGELFRQLSYEEIGTLHRAVAVLSWVV